MLNKYCVLKISFNEITLKMRRKNINSTEHDKMKKRIKVVYGA